MAKPIEFDIIARDFASPVMEKVIQTSARLEEALSKAGEDASESFKDVFKGRKKEPEKGTKENVKTKKKVPVRKEDEGITGGFTLPKWLATPLRAVGAYRLAWMTGKKIGGREEETGKVSKSGMAMGAAAGIYILQAMKDGIMKVVDILSTASPFLKAQLKILNIGFMQILKPFGDMVGMALKPLAKMMLKFSRDSRKALRDAGLTPKDKEYYETYVDMFMHQFWHMFTGKGLSDYGELFSEFAMKGAEEKETRMSVGEYLKYLGYDLTQAQADAFAEFMDEGVLTNVNDTQENMLHDFFTSLGPGFRKYGKFGQGEEHPHWEGAMEALREYADELAGEDVEDKMQWSDWADMTVAERDNTLAQTLLTESNNGLITANGGLTSAIIALTNALIAKQVQNQWNTYGPSLNTALDMGYDPAEGMYAQGMGKTYYTDRPPYYGRGGIGGH